MQAPPLSKTRREDPAFAERFEIYAAGPELGNAYTELSDPQEQYRRFEMQRPWRRPATKKRTAWTKTISAPWCTACRPPEEKARASTGW